MSRPHILLLALVVVLSLSQQVPHATACPFAASQGMMQAALPHLRRILSQGGAESGSDSGPAHRRKVLTKKPALPPLKLALPPPFCAKSEQPYSKCDKWAGYGPYSPHFYEIRGCKGGRGLWNTIVRALDRFEHPVHGKTFVKDCLAPMIRNVFHMDIGLGHNARLLLEDWGSKAKPFTKPDATITTGRSAKLAVPNMTLRCFDIYEHLRVQVDKYTAKYCPKEHVSCTDLSNYAAKYAHWKLSNGKFLPCFNFGFADAEPEDFAGDAFHQNKPPRFAAQSCMPPHDGTDVFPRPTPVAEALSLKNFNEFFTKAMETFSKPCYEVPQGARLQNKDLAALLLGHSVGQSHCFLILALNDDLSGFVKEPFQDTTFFNKLVADCTRCRAMARSGGSIPPYGDFLSNLQSDKYSFAQKCKTVGEVDHLPKGKTTGLSRLNTFLAGAIPTMPGFNDPCCVPNDVFTADRFDFQYFPQVVNRFGLFQVDNGLDVHPTTKRLTNLYAKCSQTHKMYKDYQEAWNKMNLIGAKPYDSNAKRRKWCSIPTWAQDQFSE